MYMVKTVKIGEIQTEMIGDINTTDVMNIFLRIGWGVETTSRIAFKPAENLNTGDGIRVTIEKVYEEPEPEPEPAEEATTGEVTETSEVEGGEGAPAGETADSLEAEGSGEGTAGEAAEATSEAEGGEESTAKKT